MDKQRQEPIHSAYEIREKHKRIPSPPSPQQAFPASGELHATLAISELEAQGGTSRSIRLPGGRQTIVVVPVGAYEGQVISLEGLGEPAFPGGPRGTLTLTLTIIPAKETAPGDRKSTRLNSSHSQISYAVFCLKKKKQNDDISEPDNAPARKLYRRDFAHPHNIYYLASLHRQCALLHSTVEHQPLELHLMNAP